VKDGLAELKSKLAEFGKPGTTSSARSAEMSRSPGPVVSHNTGLSSTPSRTHSSSWLTSADEWEWTESCLGFLSCLYSPTYVGFDT
jgi:hypothetical protein